MDTVEMVTVLENVLNWIMKTPRVKTRIRLLLEGKECNAGDVRLHLRKPEKGRLREGAGTPEIGATGRARRDSTEGAGPESNGKGTSGKPSWRSLQIPVLWSSKVSLEWEAKNAKNESRFRRLHGHAARMECHIWLWTAAGTRDKGRYWDMGQNWSTGLKQV